MKSRIMLALLALSAIFHACQTASIAELENSTYEMTDSCVYITELNATIFLSEQNLTLNLSDVVSIPERNISTSCNAPAQETVHLQPGESYVDSLRNISVYADPLSPVVLDLSAGQQFNLDERGVSGTCNAPTKQTVSLSPGQNFSSTSNNVDVSCMMQVEAFYILSIGQNVTLDDRNASVRCSGSINVNEALDYGENYTNAAANITITAPRYPRLNLERNLTLNGVYRNDDLNLSVRAPESQACMQNQNIRMNFGEQYTNPAVNITVFAPPFPSISVDRELGLGECYQDATLNVSICSRPLDTMNVSIPAGKTWKSEDRGLQVECRYEQVPTYVNSFDEMLQNISNCTHTVTFTVSSGNYTICTDGIETMCPTDYIVKGDFSGCLENRTAVLLAEIDEINKTLASKDDQIDRLQGDKQKLQQELRGQKAGYYEGIMPVLQVVSVVLALSLIAYFAGPRLKTFGKNKPEGGEGLGEFKVDL